MAEVIPAIIGQNFSEVEDKLNLLDQLVDWAHLDVMDGKFAPSRSWSVASDLDFIAGRVKLEVHLMVKEPEAVLGEWVRVVDRIIVHAEAVNNLPDLLQVFESHHTQLGVALLLSTPLEEIESVLDQIKFVHLMSIEEIGYQGKKFEEKVLNKIKSLRAMAPHVTISVDGGINLDNASPVLAAGADRLVIGNAIWSAKDLTTAIAEFKKIC